MNLWTCREDIVSSDQDVRITMCMHRLLMLPLKGSRGRVVCVRYFRPEVLVPLPCVRGTSINKPNAMLIHASFGMR